MISLKSNLPPIAAPLAEVVKINCQLLSYSDIALFWEQNNGDAIISMLDGNMTIYNKNADMDELLEFIKVIAPSSVFSDADTLNRLFGDGFCRVAVMKSEKEFECNLNSDSLKSDEIYSLLNVEGLELPRFEHFAVDFCHRLNGGNLKYFALSNMCAALALFDGSTALVNGIASHKKGMGSIALCGLLSGFKNSISLAVCEKAIMPFYIKNGFHHSYDAGYWRKNS